MSWPRDGEELWTELARFRRLALVAGQMTPAHRLAEVAGVEVCRVGRLLAEDPVPPESERIAALLAGQRVLVDLDVLFDPELMLDPVRLLRDLARTEAGLVAAWPGQIDAGTARFSAPGRFDRYVSPLVDTLVLRACPVVFPDETPYQLERIP